MNWHAGIFRASGFLAVLLLDGSFGFTQAEDVVTPPTDKRALAVVLPALQRDPVADGVVAPDEWERAWRSSPFVSIGGERAEVETRVRIGQTDSGLWFLFECDEPLMENLRTVETRRQSKIWLDDSVEVFLDADGDRRTYHHLVVNAEGVCYGARGSSPPLQGYDDLWDAPIRWGCKKEQDRWTAELFIPFAALSEMKPGRWGVNLCRNRQAADTPQYSCLAPMPGSFHQPAGFVPFDDVRVPDGIVTGVWHRARAHWTDASIVVEGDLDSRVPSAHNVVRLEDAAGRWIGESELALSNGVFSKWIPVVNGRAPVAVRIEVRDDAGRVLAVGGRIPVANVSQERVALAQPYFDREDEIAVAWSKSGGVPARLLLLGPGGDVLWRQSLPDASTGTTAVAIAALPPGRYRIALGGNAGAPRAESEFEKLPPHAVSRRVALDAAGVLRVDGEPFVPQCLYRVAPSQWKSVLAGTGFNTVHAFSVGAGRFTRVEGGPVVWTTPLEEICASLDLAESLGLKVMFELGVYVKEVFEIEAGEEDGRRLREVVSRFRRHPALLGYYLVDEPYAPQVARVQRARELIRRIDPDHPTLSPTLGRAFYDRPTSELADIFMLSCYPVPYLPVAEVGRRLDQARSLIGPGKPMWFVAQAVGLRGNDWFPTPDEARCMVFQALARGVTGFFYFSWFGDQPRQSGPIATSDPVFWKALKALTVEVGAIAPAWLTAQPLPVSFTGAGAIRVAARQVGGNVWILAVNAGAKPVSLSVAPGAAGAWRVWSGERWQALPRETRQLDSTLPPFGVALWEVGADRSDAIAVQGVVVDDGLSEPVNWLDNGSFESGLHTWTFSGAADVGGGALDGERCLAMSAPSNTAFARSDAFAVKAGQEILVNFHVAVDGPAGGTTVDAAVEVEDAEGKPLARLPLVGPDERVVMATDWDWMGRTLTMPAGAARARVVLGTRDNPGRTRYDAVKAVCMEDLRAWRKRPLSKSLHVEDEP